MTMGTCLCSNSAVNPETYYIGTPTIGAQQLLCMSGTIGIDQAVIMQAVGGQQYKQSVSLKQARYISYGATSISDGVYIAAWVSLVMESDDVFQTASLL